MADSALKRMRRLADAWPGGESSQIIPASLVRGALTESADLYEAAWAARSALDALLGDSDLIHDEDESSAFKACQRLSAALDAAEWKE